MIARICVLISWISLGNFVGGFNVRCMFNNEGGKSSVCYLHDVKLLIHHRERITVTGKPSERDFVSKILISGSTVEYLPRHLVMSFQNLKEIEFHGSVSLDSLKDSFLESEFSEIEVLNFNGGNTVKWIQGNALRRLPNLKKIKMTGCGMETIEENSFQSNTDLLSINFQFNEIRVLPKKIFRHLTNLLRINFAANQIEYLHKKLFKDNHQLQEINFWHNKIKQIHPQLLRGLVQLEKISFAANELEVIRGDTFRDNQHLQNILLQQNSINKVHPEVFEHLEELGEIVFYENPCYSKSFESSEVITSEILSSSISECFGNYESARDEVENVLKECQHVVEQRFPSRNRQPVPVFDDPHPWLAILFNTEEETFICGGFIISAKHVLLPTYCAYSDDQTQLINVSQVAFAFCSDCEETDYTVGVERFVLHADVNTPSKLLTGVLAIAVVQEEIEFSSTISKICLNMEPIKKFVGKMSIVSGWRFTHSSIKPDGAVEDVEAPIIDKNKCRRTNLRKSKWRKEFCAGRRDGTGPCIGSFGGGLTMKVNQKDTLFGVVSTGLVWNGTCDLKEYIVFTEVKRYYKWIIDTMIETY